MNTSPFSSAKKMRRTSNDAPAADDFMLGAYKGHKDNKQTPKKPRKLGKRMIGRLAITALLLALGAALLITNFRGVHVATSTSPMSSAPSDEKLTPPQQQSELNNAGLAALAMDINTNPLAQKVIATQPDRTGLGSSLYYWRCSNEGHQFNRAITDTKSSLDDMHRFRPKKTEEVAGGILRTCHQEFDNPLPEVYRIAQVKSQKKATLSSATLTLATQLPLERRDVLRAQCALWPGQRVAAAVFIPLVRGRVASHFHTPLNKTSIDTAVANLFQLHNELENAGYLSCALDLVILAGERCDYRNAAALPVNAARNKALMMVETPLVMLANGDTLASTAIAEAFKDQKYVDRILGKLSGKHAAMAVPGFVPAEGGEDGQRVAAEVGRQGKEAALSYLKTGKLEQYGGWSYSLADWRDANKEYDIKYEEGSEPAVIMVTTNAPFFDETMTGYPFSRSLQLTWAASELGNSWLMHPQGLTVRVPPPAFDTSAYARKVRHEQDMKDRAENEDVVVKARQLIKRGKYSPVVEEYTLCYSTEGKII